MTRRHCCFLVLLAIYTYDFSYEAKKDHEYLRAAGLPYIVVVVFTALICLCQALYALDSYRKHIVTATWIFWVHSIHSSGFHCEEVMW